MRVVLDTNIYVVGCLSHHKYGWVTETLLSGKYDLCVSNDILFEYQELISRKFGTGFIEDTVDVLVGLPNVQLVDPRFGWDLIVHDPDDNKFIDCAFAASADYIVSEDKHFRVVAEVEFPRINIINLTEFYQILFK